MFIFGGKHKEYTKQILVVDQCKLTKVGELSFEMLDGACAQREDKEVFICFENIGDSKTWKKCRRSNGPLEDFEQLPSSNYTHRATRIAVTSGKSSLLLIASYFR